jgi:hypothetical protein
VAAGFLSGGSAVGRRLSAAAIVGVIALAPVLGPYWTTQRFLADDRPLRAHAAVLGRLTTRLTNQDRVQFALPPNIDPGFLDKTALLFHLRSITDYETQISQRYAEYSMMMRHGEIMRSLNEVYFPGTWSPATLSWPLINLTAARYLVMDKSHEKNLKTDRDLPLTFLDDDRTISVYENREALPRAYYVPRIAVEPDAELRLRRLANSDDDRRRLALVDEPPASGFLGVSGNEATADARFVVDDSERIVLEMVAPERGFLFLADQYFPAWEARVNGQATPILVANHAFRLVEVPSGPVTVEFRYRSDRFWIGAVISAVTLLVVGWLLLSAASRRFRAYAPKLDADIRDGAGI